MIDVDVCCQGNYKDKSINNLDAIFSYGPCWPCLTGSTSGVLQSLPEGKPSNPSNCLVKCSGLDLCDMADKFQESCLALPAVSSDETPEIEILPKKSASKVKMSTMSLSKSINQNAEPNASVSCKQLSKSRSSSKQNLSPESDTKDKDDRDDKDDDKDSESGKLPDGCNPCCLPFGCFPFGGFCNPFCRLPPGCCAPNCFPFRGCNPCCSPSPGCCGLNCFPLSGCCNSCCSPSPGCCGTNCCNTGCSPCGLKCFPTNCCGSNCCAPNGCCGSNCSPCCVPNCCDRICGSPPTCGDPPCCDPCCASTCNPCCGNACNPCCGNTCNPCCGNTCDPCCTTPFYDQGCCAPGCNPCCNPCGPCGSPCNDGCPFCDPCGCQSKCKPDSPYGPCGGVNCNWSGGPFRFCR